MTDKLNENWRDRVVEVTRGAAAAIPLFGGFVGEIVSLIPGQRADRIVEFVRQLEERLAQLEAHRREEILSRPDKIDLVEEGGRQASHAVSSDRIPKIVEAVTRGLTSEEANLVRRKRILTLLGQIDDDEIQLLNAYGQSYGGGGTKDFWEMVNVPPPAMLGSGVGQIDSAKLFDAGRDHLLRLGLLEKAYRTVRRGEQPEFDTSTGDFRHTVRVSYLGRMLLREIGLPTAFDLPHEEQSDI